MTLKKPKDEARAHAFINAACMLHNLVLNVHPDAEYDLFIEDDGWVDEPDEGVGDGQGPTPVVLPHQVRREEVCKQLLDLMEDGDDDIS